MQQLRKYSYCKANIVLAVIQVAVFGMCLIVGDTPYILGQCGTNLVVGARQYWRLVTSVFLHAGPSHLGSNLLLQILMGNAVERNIGAPRYVILYLLSGIGGNILSVAYDCATGVNTYSVGASGAVFGVMGALIILIVKGRKKLRSGTSLLMRALFAVFFAVYSGFQNPYTDNAAHIGGLLTGLVLGLLLTSGMSGDDVDLRDLR
ncbi:MAG TPA: rhomboid family intramembrane serine protease [Lachnospiraceae bacterium]|nr:rhomboid family intramembrane serine protease [Lachnospiraceae bacterium]